MPLDSIAAAIRKCLNLSPRWASPFLRSTRKRRRRHERGLHIEALEKRSLLTNFTVVHEHDQLDANNDPVVGTLRWAVESANDQAGADTISFAANVHNIGLTSGRLLIQDDLTVNGPGPASLGISGMNQSQIFFIHDGNVGSAIDVEINDVTLSNGYAPGGGFGGAVYSVENLTLDNVDVINSTADGSGGGVYADVPTGGTLTIRNSTISGNIANQYEDPYYGYLYGGNGGGLRVINRGTATIDNTTIAGNQAVTTGGGMHANNSGVMQITEGSVSANMAGTGAGIRLANTTSGSSITISNATVMHNTATGAGGGIESTNHGSMTVVNSTISGNSAGDHGGIGITNHGTANVLNSVISGNSLGVGTTHGGGLSVSNAGGGSTMVSQTTISGNTAGYYGGLNLSNSGSTTITRSTISGNTAYFNGAGAGLFTHSGGSTTVDNSTVSGNLIANYGWGGGIMMSNDGATTISSTTIANNQGVDDGQGGNGGGSGVLFFGEPGAPPVAVVNSIIAGNETNSGVPDDVRVTGYVSKLQVDHSLVGADPGLVGGAGNRTGTVALPLDPWLGPLQNNGGLPETHLLLRNSPAIDAGSNARTTAVVDQRGETRIVDGLGNAISVVDMGAVEAEPQNDDVDGDTAETATPVALSAPIQARLQTPQDEDWFRTPLQRDRSYTILTDAATPNGRALSVSVWGAQPASAPLQRALGRIDIVAPDTATTYIQVAAEESASAAAARSPSSPASPLSATNDDGSYTLIVAEAIPEQDPGAPYVDKNNDGLFFIGDGDVLLSPDDLKDGFDTKKPEGAYTKVIKGAGLVIPASVSVTDAGMTIVSEGNLHVDGHLEATTGDLNFKSKKGSISLGANVDAWAASAPRNLTVWAKQDVVVGEGDSLLGLVKTTLTAGNEIDVQGAFIESADQVKFSAKGDLNAQDAYIAGFDTKSIVDLKGADVNVVNTRIVGGKKAGINASGRVQGIGAWITAHFVNSNGQVQIKSRDETRLHDARVYAEKKITIDAGDALWAHRVDIAACDSNAQVKLTAKNGPVDLRDGSVVATKKIDILSRKSHVDVSRANIGIRTGSSKGDVKIQAKGQLLLNNADIRHQGKVTLKDIDNIFENYDYLGPGFFDCPE